MTPSPAYETRNTGCRAPATPWPRRHGGGPADSRGRESPEPGSVRVHRQGCRRARRRLADGPRRPAAVEVRLHGVDAPEGGQAFGNVCKRTLSNLVFGKTAAVQVVDIDRYKRRVSRLTVDGRDVGLEMIRAGCAWHYRQYPDDAGYAAAELEVAEKQRFIMGSSPFRSATRVTRRSADPADGPTRAHKSGVGVTRGAPRGSASGPSCSAAAVKTKIQFTRATPRCRSLRSKPTVFIHPKTSSIRLRIR